MNLIDNQLNKIKKDKKMGLMTHVVVGYPSLEKTNSIVAAMEKAGADFVELQIPFSDPLADGPTIMKACERSLELGTKVADSFRVAEKLSKSCSIPLLFMAYFNILFVYGVEKFCRDAEKAGISGLIVPDMPIEEEENEHFLQFCKKYNVYNIPVISPSSTDDRLRKNAAVARGFVYATAPQGITDAKKGLDPKIELFLKRVKKYFSVPVAVGFGISSKERVDMIKKYADIVVVGSAIIDVINCSENHEEEAVKRFIHSLAVA